MSEARAPDRCSDAYRVRFDEAGPDGLLRTSAVLRYAQDLAWFHSSERGFTRAWYAERGLVWLARAAEVAVLTPVRVGDRLIGTTAVVSWRRVWARRRTEFVADDGSLAAWTHVDWVLVDRRGAPTRIPSEFDGVFGAAASSSPLARVPLAVPPNGTRPAAFRVRPQELDPMNHVNNAVYADWLDERVIDVGGQAGLAAVQALPRVVRLEYARAAAAGMEIRAETWSTADGAWSCRIADPADDDLLRARLEVGSPGSSGSDPA
jgi:acyl-CoA thioesterase FadM